MLFPRNIQQLLTGRHRILYAKVADVAVPARISDIIEVVGPDYDPKDGWFDVGATSAAASYAKAITKAGLNIQQTPDTVKEEIQTVERTFAFTAAEQSPLIQVISEESPGIVTLAAGANKSQEKAVDYGGIVDLTNYRIAVLALFSKSDGLVIEPGGAERGRWAGNVAYNTELSADTSTQSFGEGEIVAVPVSVKTFPEPTITVDGKQHGRWLYEQAGTIAAT